MSETPEKNPSTKEKLHYYLNGLFKRIIRDLFNSFQHNTLCYIQYHILRINEKRKVGAISGRNVLMRGESYVHSITQALTGTTTLVCHLEVPLSNRRYSFVS